MLEVDTYGRNRWSVVSLVGDLDLAEVPELRRAVGPLTGRARPRIVVDLTAVDLLDSAGMGVLLGIRRRVDRNGGEVRLVAPEGTVRALLRSVDLDRVFAVYADVETAVGSGA